jgi:SAM-dependent methyltransferase
MFTWTEESAAFWADSASFTHSYDLLAEKAAAHLVPGCTVFEGGCGLGHLSVALAQRGYAVTAMDLSPLPLRYLRESADQAGVTLTVRQGDAFSLPVGELYDAGVFCFFGGVAEVLTWAKGHCRDRLVLFKKNWYTRRFTKDPGAIRKFTYPLTCAALTRLGVPFTTDVFDVDMGQPFRSLADAVRFFQLYDPGAALTENEALSRLTETGDPVFPYYFPAVRPVGMIVLRAEEIPKIPVS